jgi:hypothetical protein
MNFSRKEAAVTQVPNEYSLLQSSLPSASI